jgi:type IV pilus biogenesis protein CpaD/CtpE
MQRYVVFSLLVLCVAAMAIAETVYTKRKSNYVREGPGAYYDLIAVVPENTALEVLGKSPGWIKVKAPTKDGWLAENCISAAKAKSTPTVAVENIWASPKASKAGISAAIKGFAQKYGKTEPGNVDLILKNSTKKFTEAEFAAFRAELMKNAPGSASPVSMNDLKLGTVDYNAGIQEQEVGLGIAARIAGKGLVNNPAVVQYANLICATIAEKSAAYDWDFTVFIVDDKAMNGFAVPGGYIFITLGALKLCADESELAGMIAHEMAHVIRGHGLQEMSKRIANIKSDAAFAELDEEVGGKSPEEADLDEVIQQTYEKIVSPRLLAYELEADRIAAVLCATAGYDPFGLARISRKMAAIPREKPDFFDPSYMAADDLGERAKKIDAFVKEEFAGFQAARMTDRYTKRTGSLR